MRVVGGTIKGRRLMSFKSSSIRPTSDKVREAIFNILPTPFPFINVLDLFAGTGALGIEAISRGAESVIFVDIDSDSIGVIKDNLDKCQVADIAKVRKRDVLSAVSDLSREVKRGQVKFDLVFLDAPYKETDLTLKVLKALKKEDVITDDCFIVCETLSKDVISEEVIEDIGFEFIKEKTYGDTSVCFMENKVI